MNEDLLREIVKSVISEMSSKSGIIQTEQLVDKIQNSCGGAKDDSCDDDDIEDFTSIEHRKNVYVPNPKDEKALKEFKNSTPARIGVWRAGDRPLTETILRFRADHALAIDSVMSTVDEKLIDEMNLLKLQTKIKNKDEHITRPDLGKELNDESIKLLKEKCIANPEIQIVISDGLSSKAIEANIKDVLSSFMQGLSVYNIKVGTPVFVKYGRVGCMDHIGQLLNAKAAIMFIGERPGLATAESMSAYMVYNPRVGLDEAERNVLSNIFSGGTPPVEAGAHISTLMKRILDEKASGINLSK